MLERLKYFWPALLLLCSATGISAQNGQVYNVTRVFNLAGTVYSQSGSLLPQHFNLYNIPVPSNVSNPDILLTLNSTSGGTDLALYCNPQYGAFASASSSYPGPGYAIWSSELTTVTNQIFISKNDAYYKSPMANSSTPLAFLCSVINNDVNTTTNYTLEANIVSDNRTLVTSEQTSIASLYSQCCSATGACTYWKSLNANASTNANGGGIRTDFCSFPGQVCTPTGNVYRLNLSAYNLSCSWPGSVLSSFSQLSGLDLSLNNNLKGNISDVLSTVANVSALQTLNLAADIGITGTIDGSNSSSICKSVQNGLVSVDLHLMGLNGSVPSCLYASGSRVIYVDLSYNNLTGSIPDTVPTGSNLQVLHVQNNSLTGKMPATLSNANYLSDLNTSCNMMTGSLPASVGYIRTLSSFVIAVNNHTGAIPDSFGTAENLKVFDVKLNNFTAFPSAWTNASYNSINSSYSNIRASFNSISGGFPSGLSNAEQLTYLIINENKLTGSLPSNASMFPSLRALNVSGNKLSGSLPAQLGQSALFSATPLYLSNGQPLAQVFDLSRNNFSGSLPTFLQRSSVPTWTQDGIYLQSNNFTVNCSDSNYSYLTSICPQGNLTQSPPPPATTSTATPAAPPTSSTSSTSTPPTSSQAVTGVATQEERRNKPGHHGLSGGAVAGVVLGVLAAVALGLFLAFFFIKRRKKGGRMPRENGSTFAMPHFGDGEFGRKSSLKKGLTSLSSGNSGFERFNDEQGIVELSKNGSKY